MSPLRWGILGDALIARDHFIPALRGARDGRVLAIASRDAEKARRTAQAFDIPRHYGSYDALLADPEIEAVYNPLPNHLHVAWSIKAAQAGKHVLCEKPLALSAADAAALIDARDRHGVLIQEGFMILAHPQWQRARELVAGGRIGELRAVQSFFSYYLADPANVRNQADIGGGGLYDVGCYAVAVSRHLFGEEPLRVAAALEIDPGLRTDRLSSAILEFPSGHASFTCGTQLAPYQSVQLVGSSARLSLDTPFTAPAGQRALRIRIDDSTVLGEAAESVEAMPAVDQFTLQADAFADAVRGRRPPLVTLESSLANMRVIDALFEAARSGRWISV
ncbi:MAG TPA: Gfo/Idh/MocA family oxidoreductase [Albitalea sp.]|nr:Gfo/Idh/MocA family oxidoreductase [Albitalea sp.]